MNEALANLCETSKMPMTPLPGSISVPDLFFFLHRNLLCQKNKQLFESDSCLFAPRGELGEKQIKSKLALFRKYGGKEKTSQEHCHSFVLQFYMRCVLVSLFGFFIIA